MTILLVLLTIGAAGAVAFALIRGLHAFANLRPADVDEAGLPKSLTVQNKMMFARVKWQAITIGLLAALSWSPARNKRAASDMVKLNKIYTRTGDDGTTGLVDGSRVSKTNARLHAIGEVDETNSALGVALQALAADEGETPLVAELRRIQNDLFDLGADIATPGESFEPSPMELRIVSSQVEWLEAAIDKANEQLPPLTSFILPGGSLAAAHMHMARAISRRAERALVAASLDVSINPQALNYINRLSDYLFVLCRLINSTRGGDIMWVPGASR